MAGMMPGRRRGSTAAQVHPGHRLEVGDLGRLVLIRDDRAQVVDTEVLRRARVTLDGEGRRLAYEVAADIERGDSGAPLLDADGRVAGIVFATSRRDEAGWVVAAAELATIEEGQAIPLSCG